MPYSNWPTTADASADAAVAEGILASSASTISAAIDEFGLDFRRLLTFEQTEMLPELDQRAFLVGQFDPDPPHVPGIFAGLASSKEFT